MTPLPKPAKLYVRKPGSTAGTSRVRRGNAIPMKPGEYLRWANRTRPSPPALRLGDTVQATGEGAGGDDVDDGYLGAIRLRPRAVGLGAGEVPLAVALRLVARGVVGRVG